MSRHFHILTFGCQMNVNDSHWLREALISCGYTESTLSASDVVLLNTCSVREKPQLKVSSQIARIYAETGKNPDVVVGILGCVAQQTGEAFFAASPQVRLVAGPDHLAEVPALLERLLAEPKLTISLLTFTDQYQERDRKGLSPSGPSAFVNIMQGCDKFCTYCIVPFTRGRQKSRTAQAILDECRQKIALGASELTLLGQNVNAFGKDTSAEKMSFAELLAEIDALPGLKRLRYTSPHPKDMEAEDIEAFATLSTLCPSLHLPLQSGSTRVLRRMARGYSRSDYLALVEKLRAAKPDLALTTDIIVGFPGERDEDLEETLEVMTACSFRASYSFCYSDRPPAKASTYLDKIASDVSHQRLNKVQALQEELSARLLEKLLGTRTSVLLEGRSRREQKGIISWQGRDPYGNLVHVPFEDDCDHTGRLIEVMITSHAKHCLFATQNLHAEHISEKGTLCVERNGL